jgi:hypothetical protein
MQFNLRSIMIGADNAFRQALFKNFVEDSDCERRVLCAFAFRERSKKDENRPSSESWVRYANLDPRGVRDNQQWSALALAIPGPLRLTIINTAKTYDTRHLP